MRVGALMNFSTVLRLAAIALGIVSAIVIAVRGFEVPVSQAFVETLEGVREFVGTIVWPLDRLVVTPIVMRLRALDIEFELFDHWKDVFVLAWLFMAATARAYGDWGRWQDMAFIWVVGALCALLSSVLAGTATLSSPNIFLWPLLGFLIWAAAITRWRVSRKDWWPTLLAEVIVPATVVGLTAYAFGFLIVSSPSPGLVSLTAFVAIWGVLAIGEGVFDLSGNGGTWLQHLPSELKIRIGIDILSVLGGAAFIVYAAHQLA